IIMKRLQKRLLMAMVVLAMVAFAVPVIGLHAGAAARSTESRAKVGAEGLVGPEASAGSLQQQEGSGGGQEAGAGGRFREEEGGPVGVRRDGDSACAQRAQCERIQSRDRGERDRGVESRRKGSGRGGIAAGGRAGEYVGLRRVFGGDHND